MHLSESPQSFQAIQYTAEDYQLRAGAEKSLFARLQEIPWMVAFRGQTSYIVCEHEIA